ncbi:ankyrin repeat-containing domain protein [Peziza echinospora]|nr:ankyrin repeat-containing domain protein [Peziza echinospora]
MSDSLPITASLSGLRAISATVLGILNGISEKYYDVPASMKRLISDIEAIQQLFAEIHRLITLGSGNQQTEHTHAGAGELPLSSLIIVLSGCVIVYSRLHLFVQKLGNKIETDSDSKPSAQRNLTVVEKLKGIFKEEEVKALLVDLQNHKLSLNTILKIISCNGTSGVKSMIVQLQRCVAQVLETTHTHHTYTTLDSNRKLLESNRQIPKIHQKKALQLQELIELFSKEQDTCPLATSSTTVRTVTGMAKLRKSALMNQSSISPTFSEAGWSSSSSGTGSARSSTFSSSSSYTSDYSSKPIPHHVEQEIVRSGKDTSTRKNKLFRNLKTELEVTRVVRWMKDQTHKTIKSDVASVLSPVESPQSSACVSVMLSDITLGSLSAAKISISTLKLPIFASELWDSNFFQHLNTALSRAPSVRHEIFSKLTAGRLHRAIAANNGYLVGMFLSLGADVEEVDSKGRTPLEHVLASDYMGARWSFCRLLLNKGAKVNWKKLTWDESLIKFYLALKAGDLGVGVNVDMEETDSTGLTALAYAFGKHLNTLCLQLIQHGASLEPLKNIQKWPPHCRLSNAARNGHTELIRIHLSLGVHVDDDLDRYNMTPLLLAAWFGHEEAAIHLIEAGADIFAKDKNGWTIIHVAANTKSGHKILEHVFGNDKTLTIFKHINSPDYNGSTPLHMATRNNLLENMRFLITHGGDPTIKCTKGLSAVDMAGTHDARAILTFASIPRC